MTAFLAFVVVLGVLVFVHEGGHFLAAKAAGIFVHRFSLGLGAPIKWLTFIRNGTEYSISWVPLGGYVKMASQEEDSASGMLEGTATASDVPAGAFFESKPIWVRLVVILAGVTMNFLFAWLVFSGLILKNGKQALLVRTIGGVTVDSLPASARGLANLALGDSITAVNGAPVTAWGEIIRGITDAPTDSIVIEVAGKPAIRLMIPSQAASDRMRAAIALQYYVPAVVGQLEVGLPAERAGLAVGDTILAVDSIPVRVWSQAVAAIEARPNRPIRLTVARGAEHRTVSAISITKPGVGPDGRSREVGRLGVGVAIPPVRSEPVGFFRALKDGMQETVRESTALVGAIRGILTGQVSTRELGGPIMIGRLAGQTAKLGWQAFLTFMAIISVNLAIMNLLPIPILDGGQVMFLLGEAILRRPLSVRVRERLTMVGLVVIVLLMTLAMSNDIRRWLGV